MTGDRMRAALAIAGAMTIFANAADAGPVGSACMMAGRSASQPLCTCLQHVADLTLTGPDQKLAANMIRDPMKAEEIRVSDRARNKAFWSRYVNFASTAGSVCVAG
jgi:Flp pilus assembly protein TadB